MHHSLSHGQERNQKEKITPLLLVVKLHIYVCIYIKKKERRKKGRHPRIRTRCSLVCFMSSLGYYFPSFYVLKSS